MEELTVKYFGVVVIPRAVAGSSPKIYMGENGTKREATIIEEDFVRKIGDKVFDIRVIPVNVVRTEAKLQRA